MRPAGPHRDVRRSAIRGSLIALALAIAAGVWLAAWPCFYTGRTGTTPGSTDTGRPVCATLIGENGAWVVWLLLVPVVLSTIAWIGAIVGKRIVLWAAGTLTLAFCIVGAWSIGVFYLPAAIALLVTATLARRRPRRRRR